MAPSTNGRNYLLHMNPPLPTVHPRPQPGHAGSSSQGSSSQVPSGRVGQLPNHLIRRDAYHPYKPRLSVHGLARELALLQDLLPPPTLKPTRRLIPETTADADTNNTLTEEEESVVSDFYRSHLPRVTELLVRRQKRKRPRLEPKKEKNRDGRKKEQCDIRELRRFVQRWKGLTELPSRNQAVAGKNFFMKRNDAPNPINCVADSCSYIQSIRSQIYTSPRLVTAEPKQQSPVDKKTAMVQRVRRMEDRLNFETLSQYYQLPGFAKEWGRPQLIMEGKHGHDHSSRGCHSTHLHPSQC